MTTGEKVRQYTEGIVVLRDIDYSSECGFWLVPMRGSEFEQWWRSQPTFSSNPDGALDGLYAVFNETPPPHSKLNLPGELLVAETQDEVDLWVKMAEAKDHYFCNLCCDEDSYLRQPDGKIIRHAGFKA